MSPLSDSLFATNPFAKKLAVDAALQNSGQARDGDVQAAAGTFSFPKRLATPPTSQTMPQQHAQQMQEASSSAVPFAKRVAVDGGLQDSGQACDGDVQAAAGTFSFPKRLATPPTSQTMPQQHAQQMQEASSSAVPFAKRVAVDGGLQDSGQACDGDVQAAAGTFSVPKRLATPPTSQTMPQQHAQQMQEASSSAVPFAKRVAVDGGLQHSGQACDGDVQVATGTFGFQERLATQPSSEVQKNVHLADTSTTRTQFERVAEESGLKERLPSKRSEASSHSRRPSLNSNSSGERLAETLPPEFAYVNSLSDSHMSRVHFLSTSSTKEFLCNAELLAPRRSVLL